MPAAGSSIPRSGPHLPARVPRPPTTRPLLFPCPTMSRVSTYLNFPHATAEAFPIHRSIFGVRWMFNRPAKS
jgi:hypothetical protein